MERKCLLCGKVLTRESQYCSSNCKALLYYYRNRNKKIAYQQKYDKDHIDKKRAYDKKRRETTDKNKLRAIQSYSTRHHLPILMNMFQGCQLCGSEIKLEVHHKKYNKKLKDCMLLCQPCHKKIHRKVFN